MLPPNKEEAETVTLLLTPQEKRRLGMVSRTPRKFRHPRIALDLSGDSGGLPKATY
jgi:hypothetical protein